MFSFAEYGQANGLSNLHISSIVQDQDGFIWVGTEHGLYRYAGGSFVAFGASAGLGNEYIYGLFVDREGRLWVGTDNGLFVTSSVACPQFVRVEGPNQQSLRVVGANSAFSNETGFAQLRNGDLLVIADGRLWEISHLARASAAEWQARPFFQLHPVAGHPDEVAGVLVARDGSVWLGCALGLCQIAHGQLKKWGPEGGVPSGRWAGLFQDGSGTIWARTSTNVIALPAGGAAFVERMAGLPRRQVSGPYLRFAEDRSGRVLTPFSGGLGRWNQKTMSWDLLDRRNGLPSAPISAVFVARDGSPWLGVFGRGVQRWLGYGSIRSWIPADGLASPIVWAILQTSPSQVLVATEKGLDTLDPGTGAIRPWAPWAAHQNGPAVLYLVRSSDGDIWLVTRDGGVFEYDPRSRLLKAYSRLPSNEMNHVLADAHDRVWIATDRGLYVAEALSAGAPKRLVRVESPNFGSKNFFTVVGAPDGSIWCTNAHGLFHLVAGQWRRISAGNTGLSPRMGDLVVNRDGTLWASNYTGGLVHIWLRKGRMVRDQKVLTPRLASNQIVFLSAGPDGWVWAGGDNGVDVYNGHVWRRVSQDNGLLWNDLDLNAFDAPAGGAVWLGTSAGLTEVRDPRLLFAPLHVRAYIVRARYGGHRLLGNPRGEPWSHGTLETGFTALGATSGNAVWYRYRLKGLEDNWTYTRTGEARFPGIGAGRYVLQVQAFDLDQHISSPTVSAAILILPPWWQTVWFRLVLGLIAVLLIWSGVRWRERMLRGRQRELEALVEARTRELEAEKRELEAARAELQVQATHDSLTGLWNRSAIAEILEREICRSAREGGRLGVVMVDLDHFKSINDRFGHRCGDQVLVEASRRFRAAIRPYDGVGRWGGEEFLILLPGLARAQGARRLETLRVSINTVPIETDSGLVSLTCSFGVVWVAGNADARTVLEEADQALYTAKRAGRDRIEYASASI